MEKLTEVLIGNLSLREPDERMAFLSDKINSVIKPPKAVTADNVNIRAMYIVNDLVNSHGGRFQRDDLQRICELICDTPVLVGHNRADAPLARTFHAELEEKDGVVWVKSYFYWPKTLNDISDDLQLKIDSGVLKECSISFVYAFPECSICGEDFRQCSHQSSQSSDNSNVHFIYRGSSQVLETSLVYKGSVRGTYITDKLWHQKQHAINDISDLPKIEASDFASDSNIAIVALGNVDSSDLNQAKPNEELAFALAIRNKRSYLLIKRK